MSYCRVPENSLLEERTLFQYKLLHEFTNAMPRLYSLQTGHRIKLFHYYKKCFYFFCGSANTIYFLGASASLFDLSTS
jgi:hypothetical protein